MAGGKKKGKAVAAAPSANSTPGQNVDAKNAGGQPANTKSSKSPKAKGSPGDIVKAKTVSLEELFSKLQGHITKNEFSKVVRTTDEILQLSPGDIDAVRCKVVALIQTNNVEEALKCIESVSKPPAAAAKGKGQSASVGPGVTFASGVAQDLIFEKAYCLYRQNRLKEALSCLEKAERTPGVLQLEGQVQFRLGDTEKCILRFEELLKKHKSEVSSNEVKTNVIAAYVQGGRSLQVQALLTQLKVAPRDAFDIAYNVACSLIELRDFAGAEQMLLLARRVGQEVLIEDDFSPEEIEEELTPITVQLAYLQQVQGRKGEALESYNALLKRKLADAPSVAVAVSNLAALRNTKDVPDSLRRLDKATGLSGGDGASGEDSASGIAFQDGLDLKLSELQKAVILHNRFLLLLLSGKAEEAGEMLPSLDSLLRQCPSQLLPLHASLLLREGKDCASLASELASAAAKLGAGASYAARASSAPGSRARPLPDGFTLEGLPWSAAGLPPVPASSAPRGPSSSPPAGALQSLTPQDTTHLLTAQAAAAEGRFLEAARELELVDSAKMRPVVVATVVDLKERASDVAGAEAVLDEALAWWGGSMPSESSPQQAANLELLLRAAAQFKQRHGRSAAAADIYRTLAKQATSANSKAEAQASLVLCLASLDPVLAEEASQELPPLGGGLDPLHLEKLGNAALPSRPGKRAAADDEAAAKERKRARKKLKRKKILPKGLDPSNPGPPPDPERWLPRQERSSFKPKRKDKKKIDVRGAQGAAVKDKLDVGAMAAQGAAASAGAETGAPDKSAKGKGKVPAAEAKPEGKTAGESSSAKKKSGKKGRK